MTNFISILGNVLLFSLVFGMSATVEIASVQSQLRNYRALLTGMICQFILLPLLGFITVRSLSLNHAVGLMILVVTSSPGGSYSNWFVSLFNAELALSVSMTAISTFFSMIMLPVNLFIYTNLAYHDDVVATLDWKPLLVALVLVMTAISAGLLCSAKMQSTRFKQMANQLGNLSGLCLILFSATMTNTGDADSKIWARNWSFYVAIVIPCLGGMILANLIASSMRLTPPERMTVSIECCYQNVGIATSMALTMFVDADLNDAMGVPFMYGLTEGVLVALYCLASWKLGWTKAPADTPFWTFITTSYEVLMQQNEIDQVEVLDTGNDKENKTESISGSTLNTYFSMV